MIEFFGRKREEKKEESPKELGQSGTMEQVFESLLASRLRLQILRKSPLYNRPMMEKEREPSNIPPIDASGDIFYVGDGVMAVVGDVDIPDGSILDESLVVKGDVKVGANCLIRRNLKALGSIFLAEGCIVKANLASGDAVELGEKTVIEGDVQAESVRLSDGAGIRGLVKAKSVYVARKKLHPTTLERMLSEATKLLGEDYGEHSR